MSSEIVSFSKTMIEPNISKHPWQLVVPRKFRAHFPCQKEHVILVDENEREYRVMFLVNFVLGRGWRDFVTAKGLLVGDKVSFRVINRGKFKVHITRASRFIENEFQNNVPVGFGKRKEHTCFDDTVTKKYVVSCAGGRHQMQKDGMLSQNKKRVLSKEKVIIRSPHRSRGTNGADGNSYVDFNDCPTDDEHTKIVVKELPDVDTNDETLLELEDDSISLECQTVSGESSESALSLTAFEDFKIHVNGETLDSEIPQDVRSKYYQLCCGQKKLIHDGIVKGLNSKFAVAVILEIVRIADHTKAATISTSSSDLECMGKTLQSFEDLGFAVGSLRAKISTLTIFSNEHKNVDESTSVKLAEIERERIAFQEMKSKIDELIESAMAQYVELIRNLEMKVDALKDRREKLGFVFKKVAALTW